MYYSRVMQQYNVDKLKGAFAGKKRFEGYTLSQLARDAGYSLTTVARILDLGRGRETSVDKVARALGFSGGREDVVIGNGHGHKKRA